MEFRRVKPPKDSSAVLGEKPVLYSSPGDIAGKDERIQRALYLFHSCHVIVITEIAAQLNISASRFRHLFKQELGLSPGYYIRLVKLDRAKRLLASTFLSVKEITAQIGVNDVSHFVRDYKARYGHNPSEERIAAAQNPYRDQSRV